MDDDNRSQAPQIPRREFLTGLGAGFIGSGLFVAGVFTGTRLGLVSEVGTEHAATLPLPNSTGYILVDSRKCSGCRTCMMACSLVHEGRENMTLSRIQVLKNTFGHFPHDLSVNQCRQCVDSPCVQACATGALHVDERTGVRLVTEGACIGCQRCVEACPQAPGRMIWNASETAATKCDLCAGSTYWDQRGGPGGKQACAEVCPMKAITFASAVPVQTGTVGYDVDLKTPSYLALVAVVPDDPSPATAATPASTRSRGPVAGRTIGT